MFESCILCKQTATTALRCNNKIQVQQDTNTRHVMSNREVLKRCSICMLLEFVSVTCSPFTNLKAHQWSTASVAHDHKLEGHLQSSATDDWYHCHHNDWAGRNRPALSTLDGANPLAIWHALELVRHQKRVSGSEWVFSNQQHAKQITSKMAGGN